MNTGISNSISENWTDSAIDCYELGGRCENCFLYSVIFRYSPSPCKMKYTVKKLLRKVGLPYKNEEGAYSKEGDISK